MYVSPPAMPVSCLRHSRFHKDIACADTVVKDHIIHIHAGKSSESFVNPRFANLYRVFKDRDNVNPSSAAASCNTRSQLSHNVDKNKRRRAVLCRREERHEGGIQGDVSKPSHIAICHPNGSLRKLWDRGEIIKPRFD